MPIWIIAVQWLSRSVLGVLLFLSVWSVATMIRCFSGMKEANGSAEDLAGDIAKVKLWIEKRQWDQLAEWAGQGKSLHSGTVRTILKSLGSDPTQGLTHGSQIDRAVKSYLSLERTRLEEGLTILATLGSNAPFIGLFGTVLGIIHAFGALGTQQNNTADIMVGISEALVATAIGLFVAIPAVIAFNVFSRKLRVMLVSSEAIKDLYLASKGGE